MEECWRQVNGCSVPDAFKLKLVNSMLRQMNEVSALQRGIEEESGFEADTTSYLNILLAKEESDLMRRVSHCRCLKQVRAYIRPVPRGLVGLFVPKNQKTFTFSFLSPLFSLSVPRFFGFMLSSGLLECTRLPATIWMPSLYSGTLHPILLPSCMCVSPANKPPLTHTKGRLYLSKKEKQVWSAGETTWMDGCEVQPPVGPQLRARSLAVACRIPQRRSMYRRGSLHGEILRERRTEASG